MPQETYIVLKEFNKYKTIREKVSLPNELIGEIEVAELLESGHIGRQPKPAPRPVSSKVKEAVKDLFTAKSKKSKKKRG